MSYSKDREAFVWKMARGFDDLAVTVWNVRGLLLNAGILQRAAEVDCSVSNEAIRAHHERRAKDAARNIAIIAGKWNLKATMSGDPRGYVVSLYEPDQDTDSEEPFARVPAQGYSASQMARMTGRA